MTSFRHLPIRRKLTLAFFSTAFAALLLACGAFVAHEKMTFRKSVVENLTVLADTLGKSCTVNLRFENKEEAEEALSALSFEPSVMTGCLFTEKGDFFAGYSIAGSDRNFPSKPGEDGADFSDGDLSLYRPVMLNGRRIGTIYLKASLDAVRQRIISYIGISGAVLLGSLSLSFALSAGLQRLISKPILSLADAATSVTERKDYSIRVPITTADEIGMLTESFNQMLADIQNRDSSLKKTNVELTHQNQARAEAEQQLKNMNERLELRVTERTRALQKSNEELEQFAYVASHDLQEPLRMVSSYMQLLERRYKGNLDGDADKFINFAVDGAKRMQILIHDLLAYSRVGTKGNPMVLISSEPIVRDVLKNLSLAIQEAGATITHDRLPDVVADPVQVGQVFQNLLANALKFRGREPSRVHIHVMKDDQFWRFSVEDNGIGIDRQFFDRIFVIFQRLHNRGEYPGTGIGLAVCKKIIERHGGRIWVESTSGRGTTFHFTLPAAPH